MNDEANTSSAKLSKSAILSILFWACVFLLALCIFIFARVHAVRINGNQLYTKEQLLLDCGITLGDRLYGMDRDEIEAQILQKFPMIEAVSVDRGGFFSVVIDVKERQSAYYIVHEDDGTYLYLSDNFYVLEKSEISPAQKGLSLLCLTTPTIVDATYGKQIKFETEKFPETHRDSNYNMHMISFLTELNNAPFYSRLTSADLTKPFLLSVFIGNTEIYLKNQSLLPEKFAAVASVLEQHAAQLSQIKKINASDPQRVTPFFVES